MSNFSKESKKTVANKLSHDNGKRVERLNLPLTSAEKTLINDRAELAALSRTDFILAAVRNEKIIVITGLPEVNKQLFISTNLLSQIAKRLNSQELVSDEEILAVTEECREAYRALMGFIDRWAIRITKAEVYDHDLED